MSRNAKIVLAVAGGSALLILCICGVAYFGLRSVGTAFEKSISSDPTKVAEVKLDMAQFDLPPGYEATAMDFFGLYTGIMAVRGQQNGQMIMLVQISGLDIADQEKVQQQMELSFKNQSGSQNVDWRLVEQTYTNIRGEKVLLTVREGTNTEGGAFRNLFCIFPGEKGGVMLMIFAPTSSWNVKEINRFINSIQ